MAIDSAVQPLWYLNGDDLLKQMAANDELIDIKKGEIAKLKETNRNLARIKESMGQA